MEDCRTNTSDAREPHTAKPGMRQARSCEPQPACAAAALLAVGAAVGLAAFVFTTYDAFDHNGFDFRASVVAPVMAVFGVDAGPSGPADRVASSSTSSPAAASR